MTYRHLDTFFRRSDEVHSAAEAHGLATGMLCINGLAQSRIWLKQMFDQDDAISLEQSQLLVRLFEETRTALESQDYEFEPFLPADDVPLSEQITALIDWCHGFLFGVSSLNPQAGRSGQTREILHDIAEFTRLDPDAEGEDDEAAFMEITEYLRTAVLLLRAELASHERGRLH